MPELPEVQTIVNDLNKKIIGYTIVGFDTDFKKAIKSPFAEFVKIIGGRKILAVKRLGKFLIFELSGSKLMVVHLRMTGSLQVDAGKGGFNASPSGFFFPTGDKYIHHFWTLKKGRVVAYLKFSDVRKFATIRLSEHKEASSDHDLSRLGVDALSPELSLKKLKEILERKADLALRKVLLDQNVISGIGNIYASEIMHKAKLNPLVKAGNLGPEQIKNLHKAIRSILTKAVRMRGTTISDYRDAAGSKGKFQEVLKVYGRQGNTCREKSCKGKIQKQVIGQRSAFFCSSCQDTLKDANKR